MSKSMLHRSKSSLFFVLVLYTTLGAITIPQYIAAKAATGDATAQSDLRKAMTALARYNVTNGTYPATIGELEASGYSLSSRMSWDKYEVRIENGSETVHMHVQYADSNNAWHANYPEKGTEIEIR